MTGLHMHVDHLYELLEDDAESGGHPELLAMKALSVRAVLAPLAT